MSLAAVASSPATENNGDGKKSASGNVSASDAVAMFVKTMTPPVEESTQQTAETSPQTEAEASQESTNETQDSAAEQSQTVTPDTESAESTETPEQTKTEGEAQTEAEVNDDVLSPESQQLDAKTKAKIQKRIDREVGKRKAMEAQIEGLKQQLGSMQPQQTAQPVIQPDAPAPLPDIKDPASLVKYRNDVKSAVRNVEALLDSEAVETTGRVTWQGQEYTKADLKAHLRAFRDTLEEQIPAQQEYFTGKARLEQQRAAATQAAIGAFPYLAERDNREVAQAHATLTSQFPGIDRQPNYAFLLGTLIEGTRALASKQQKTVASKETTQDSKAVAAKPAAQSVKPKAPSDQVAVSTIASPGRNAASLNRAPQAPKGNLTQDSAVAFLTQQMEARAAARR